MSREINLSSFLLADGIDLYRVETVRPILKYLNLPKPWPSRKAEMIEAITARLLGDGARDLWRSLDETQQLAVREAVHGPKGGFDQDSFSAKYGKLPKGFEHPDRGYYELSLPIQLVFFSEHGYFRSFMAVPEDLAERLKEFALPPDEALIESVDNIKDTVERHDRAFYGEDKVTTTSTELIVHNMEHIASRDLLSVLQLVDRDKISVSAKTARPSAASITKIVDVLDGGDFFEVSKSADRYEQTIGPVRAFAWPLLVQAGKLAELHGSKLALTKRGYAALGAPVAESLRALWQQWLKKAPIDEFSRVDDIKGQQRGKGRNAMTAKDHRREVVSLALAECPVGRWVHFDDFSDYMRAAGFEFEVTYDPWRLYIADPEYGRLGYSDFHNWGILQARYAMCLLFEYCATLGMVDIAFTRPHFARYDYRDMWGADQLYYLSRYDGLEYFRLNSLGAYCLGIASEYESTVPVRQTQLTIFPDLRLRSKGSVPSAERLLIETFAEPEGTGVWRLDAAKSLESIESGHALGDLRDFLEESDEQPLPETVEGFFRKVERGSEALQAPQRALLIKCNDAETAQKLSAHKHTARYCQLVGDTHLVVRVSMEPKFRKALRELGYALPRG